MGWVAREAVSASLPKVTTQNKVKKKNWNFLRNFHRWVNISLVGESALFLPFQERKQKIFFSFFLVIGYPYLGLVLFSLVFELRFVFASRFRQTRTKLFFRLFVFVAKKKVLCEKKKKNSSLFFSLQSF